MRLCSEIKVTHGGKTLIDHTGVTGPNSERDHLADGIALDGMQLVQEAPGVGATGRDRFPRANESHTLTFTRVRRYGSLALAINAVFSGRSSSNVSRAKADATIAVNGGSSFTLADAVVEAWPGRLRTDGDGTWVEQSFRLRGEAIT